MTIQETRPLGNKKVYFTSLGCSKNLVDSQVMLGHMGLDGFEVARVPESAAVIIVNTCSFIDAAKQESIETILELADYKNPDQGVCQALVVSGCMAQRYSEQLEKAAGQLEKLNSMYSQQAKDSAESSAIFLKNMEKDSGTHSSYNKQVAENAEQLKMQMEALSSNLESINEVYKGMLSAMNKN